jgi:hypothetical protein
VINPKTEAMVEHLLNQGAITMHSIDDNGEMLYSVTDKLKLVNPKLYEDLIDQYESHMFELIDLGPKTMKWKIR